MTWLGFVCWNALNCITFYDINFIVGPCSKSFPLQMIFSPNDIIMTWQVLKVRFFVYSLKGTHNVKHNICLHSYWFVILTGCRDIYHCLCPGPQKSEPYRKSKQLLERSLFNRATVHSHGKFIVLILLQSYKQFYF